MSECECVLPSEEELQQEKEKMYEAIGYSENAELAIYPREVHVYYTCVEHAL